MSKKKFKLYDRELTAYIYKQFKLIKLKRQFQKSAPLLKNNGENFKSLLEQECNKFSNCVIARWLKSGDKHIVECRADK